MATPSFSESDKASTHWNERVAPPALHSDLSPIGEDDDEALKVLAIHASEVPFTPEEERRVLWKIDLMVMPIMIVTAGLQLIDKSIYGTSCVFGMCKALHLFVPHVVNGKTVNNTGNYSWASAIFYIGYLVGLYPLSYIAQRYPIGRVCAIYTLLWALVVIAQIGVKDYAGAQAQRFMLGFIESGVSPAYTQITGMWFKKDEQALRLPIWYGGGFIVLGLSYFVTYALVHVHSSMAIWRIIFLFWGCVTLLWGVIAYLVLPDSPVTARWFTERERYIAIERLRENQDTVKNKHFKKEQVLEAFLDPRIWLMVIPGGIASTFIPVIVSSLGYNQYKTILMSSPGFFLSGVFGIGLGYFCRHVKGGRIYATAATMLVPLAGCLMLWKVPRSNTTAALLGVYMSVVFASSFFQSLAFIPSNTAGSTKKATASAMAFMAYCCGNIAGPLVLKATQAPLYTEGFEANTIAMAISIVLLILYRFVMARENRIRDDMGDIALEDHAFHDLTDRKNKTFRYAL